MRRFWIVCLLAAHLGTACGNDPPTAPTPPPLNVPFSSTDLTVGTGAVAVLGRNVTVNYTGWLYSTSAADNKGTQFDTGSNAPFLLNPNGLILGWVQGIPGMRVGGVRRLVIPPDLAYGVAGRPPQIPSNATLLFEIELLAAQ